MAEIVQVLSAEQYFRKYAIEGIGKGGDRWFIKQQLVDAFKKEMFGLVALRTQKYSDIPKEQNIQAMHVARNVIHDSTLKWKKICKMFSQYKETAGLLTMDDIRIDNDMEVVDADE